MQLHKHRNTYRSDSILIMMYKAKQINAATLNPIPFTTPINIYKKHTI